MKDSLFQRDDVGSEPWWQAVACRGTPLIEPTVAGRYRLTFVWRDPEGLAERSRTRRVWLNITGVTDHHQPGLPQSLRRLPGSDVWAWETELEGGWRGSYCLIPSGERGTVRRRGPARPPGHPPLVAQRLSPGPGRPAQPPPRLAGWARAGRIGRAPAGGACAAGLGGLRYRPATVSSGLAPPAAVPVGQRPAGQQPPGMALRYG
ncbi:hypothetical protein QE393_002316 [Pseudomonas sp. SORGH_AS 211]|nr:hypothetical protein [Pseudomonas sp. SORGH_AS_0211]